MPSSPLRFPEHRLEAQTRDTGDLLQRLGELPLTVAPEALGEAPDDHRRRSRPFTAMMNGNPNLLL